MSRVKFLLISIFIILLNTVSTEGAEELSIITYYPPPKAAYRKMYVKGLLRIDSNTSNTSITTYISRGSSVNSKASMVRIERATTDTDSTDKYAAKFEGSGNQYCGGLYTYSDSGVTASFEVGDNNIKPSTLTNSHMVVGINYDHPNINNYTPPITSLLHGGRVGWVYEGEETPPAQSLNFHPTINAGFCVEVDDNRETIPSGGERYVGYFNGIGWANMNTNSIGLYCSGENEYAGFFKSDKGVRIQKNNQATSPYFELSEEEDNPDTADINEAGLHIKGNIRGICLLNNNGSLIMGYSDLGDTYKLHVKGDGSSNSRGIISYGNTTPFSSTEASVNVKCNLVAIQKDDPSSVDTIDVANLPECLIYAEAKGPNSISVMGETSSGKHGVFSHFDVAYQYWNITALKAVSENGIAVYGESTNGWAGYFQGRITTTKANNPGGKHVYDVAELIPVEDDVLPGDVVVINRDKVRKVKRCNRAYDSGVAGVISEKPQFALGDIHKANNNPEKIRYKYLALAGKVYANVDAGYSEIKIGDSLVASPTPGHLMKAEPVLTIDGVKLYPSTAVVGKALESLEKGKKRILILLTL